MTWLVLLVLSMATYRTARLVSTDEVTAPMRDAVARRWPPSNHHPNRWETGLPIPAVTEVRASWPRRLVACEWCTSLWVALALVLVAHFCGLIDPWAWTLLAWPAVATGSGLITRVAS